MLLAIISGKLPASVKYSIALLYSFKALSLVALPMPHMSTFIVYIQSSSFVITEELPLQSTGSSKVIFLLHSPSSPYTYISIVLLGVYFTLPEAEGQRVEHIAGVLHTVKGVAGHAPPFCFGDSKWKAFHYHPAPDGAPLQRRGITLSIRKFPSFWRGGAKRRGGSAEIVTACF